MYDFTRFANNCQLKTEKSTFEEDRQAFLLGKSEGYKGKVPSERNYNRPQYLVGYSEGMKEKLEMWEAYKVIQKARETLARGEESLKTCNLNPVALF